MFRRSPVALAILVAACASPRPPAVLVFAASSLVEVMPKVAAAWRAKGGRDVTFSFDASSRLASELEAGAPADVFVSADEAWMDALEAAKTIEPGSRVDLLGNELVVVSKRDRALAISDLATAKVRRIAVAGENVPAGRYARASLASLGLFDAVQPKLVNAVNVRQALALAAQGEVDAAFVYQSDAPSQSDVLVVAKLPDSSHPPVRYPAALVHGASTDAAKFLDFCRSAKAAALFESAGFRPLARQDG